MKKKLVFLMGALLLVAGIAVGVDAQRGKGFQGRGSGGLFEQLGLTDAQQEQLREMRQKLRAEMQSTWESDERPDPEEMQKIRKAHLEKLESVLNEEQLAKLADFKAKFGADGQGFFGRMWGQGPGAMMGHRGGRWGRGPGGMRGRGMWGGPEGNQESGRGGNVYAQLNLSDEQKAKLKELRGEHREAIEELRDKHREEMEKVLTKEQRKELEELKDEAFYGGGRKGMRGRKHSFGR
jgi:Spy/CpxP family protein refolding chaperone